MLDEYILSLHISYPGAWKVSGVVLNFSVPRNEICQEESGVFHNAYEEFY
jgi:hypothetical protein